MTNVQNVTPFTLCSVRNFWNYIVNLMGYGGYMKPRVGNYTEINCYWSRQSHYGMIGEQRETGGGVDYINRGYGQGCGARAGAGRSRNFWLEPEPEPVY